MNVYIPSRSRYAVKSLTLERIIGGCGDPNWNGKGGFPESRVFLVVPTDQAKLYKTMPNRGNVRILACPAKGIAGTRKWIGENSETDKFLMLDDDLRFFYRPTVRPLDDPLPGAGEPNDKPPRLYRAKAEHIAGMFKLVERALDKYAHVAIGAREGNNTFPYPYAECKRPLRALAYRRGPFLACEHGRVAIMEDFDITLQLLRTGYKNCVLSCYAQDQYMTSIEGGCSDYRTLELHEKNVRKLQQLHPMFVSTRQKNNKHGGSFGKRLEVTIFWKQAWESSMYELGLL